MFHLITPRIVHLVTIYVQMLPLIVQKYNSSYFIMRLRQENYQNCKIYNNKGFHIQELDNFWFCHRTSEFRLGICKLSGSKVEPLKFGFFLIVFHLAKMRYLWQLLCKKLIVSLHYKCIIINKISIINIIINLICNAGWVVD